MPGNYVHKMTDTRPAHVPDIPTTATCQHAVPTPNHKTPPGAPISPHIAATSVTAATVATATEDTSDSDTRADAETLDRVYRALLRSLNLTPQHQHWLSDPHGDRRMTIEEIVAFGAKSAPERDIELCRELAQRFGGDTLLSVPGFYRDPRSGLIRLNVPRHALLIPVWRDARISGHPDAARYPRRWAEILLAIECQRTAHVSGCGGRAPGCTPAEWWPLGGTGSAQTSSASPKARSKAFGRRKFWAIPFSACRVSPTGASAGVVELAQQIAGRGRHGGYLLR